MTADDAREIGEELVRLASADNFRDVAGTGYPTSDGDVTHAGAREALGTLLTRLAESDAPLRIAAGLSP